ncbi:MAG: RNA polymerase subunit sigma-24 [Verrucomicrobia bacterium]|nr:MAG: RNA polymerase subunit sigma-24 [Verrucomicrobiota bacterium]
MQNLPGTVYGQTDPFAATHWSVIVAAGKTQADPESARAALAQLCQTYWPPLYTYVRGRGYSVHDAQDLTQGFFAYLIEHKIHLRADRQMGKFRSFLLASLKHFLSHAREREQTLKRGGGREFIPFDEARAEEAESLFQTHSSSGSSALPEERLFERTWAETLVETALGRLAAAYKAEGKENLFESFQTFVAVGADPLPTYSELATRLAVAESTIRSHVTRLRGRYREMLRAEVRRTVDTESEVDEELRELLRVLIGN